MLITNQLILDLTKHTTKLLNNNKNELLYIKWTDGEANLDTQFSKLACDYCEIAWNIIKKDKNNLEHISIKCDIPDINIKFYDNFEEICQYKIELKSSKNKNIPGSTINKLDINIPVIFCYRNNDTIICKYSQYYHMIGDNDFEKFQDRTPRPIINFSKMFDDNYDLEYIYKNKNCWIKHYADCSINRLNNGINTSWQDELIKLIKDRIIEEYIVNTTIQEFQDKKNTLNM